MLLEDLPCFTCGYLKRYATGGGPKWMCRLDHRVVNGSCARCTRKDMDLKGLCGSCRHYVGWGDWGLGCKADYHKLPSAYDEACEDYDEGPNAEFG